MGQVVDTETAKEFMAEILAVVDIEELARITADVEAKSAWFRETLSAERLPSLTEDEYDGALGRIFSARRKQKMIAERYPFVDARARMVDLIHGSGDVQGRFQSFVDGLDGLPLNTRNDLASELLHFTDPERYWLWTRWMWDPKAKTGALPLVASASFDLTGETAGETYMKVGQGIAFVHEVGGAAGFQSISRSVFGTDVFLCSVYVVYAYTVLKMRMTQEFNKVMPGLPEFCRRLLGVHVRESKEPVTVEA